MSWSVENLVVTKKFKNNKPRNYRMRKMRLKYPSDKCLPNSLGPVDAIKERSFVGFVSTIEKKKFTLDKPGYGWLL